MNVIIKKMLALVIVLSISGLCNAMKRQPERRMTPLQKMMYVAATQNSEGQRIRGVLKEEKKKNSPEAAFRAKVAATRTKSSEEFDEEVTSGSSWYGGFDEDDQEGPVVPLRKDPAGEPVEDDSLLSPEELAAVEANMKASSEANK